jgi:hypothetical protein
MTLWYGSGPDTPLPLRLSETPLADPVAQTDTPPDKVISANAAHHVENDEPSSATPSAVERKRARRPPARPRRKQAARSATIVNRAGVVVKANILIIALQEVLDYDPARNHNQPAPALWRDDPSYRKDVTTIIFELRQLNSLLETKRPQKKEASRLMTSIGRHFDKFFQSYASWLSKGTAVLTLGAVLSLLEHAGLGLDPVALGLAAFIAGVKQH